MALDINQLRAAFSKKQESSEGGNTNTGFWSRFYQFYKMGFDEVAVWRFLPDADDENPLGFIVENKYHELNINGKRKQIACLKMYGESCPCCEKSSEYYNQGDARMGKTFWRKIDYIASGLVVDSPFDYPIKPDENPVRLISMSKQLYEKVETEIVKGDLDEMPYHMENGYDFRIIKNKKIVPGENGAPAKEYGNYSDSGFARRSTPVDPNLLGRVELLDLKNFRFTKVEREQMEAMIEAFLTGRSYDDNGGNQAKSLEQALSSPKPTQSAESVVAAVSAPAPAPAAPSASGDTGGKLTPQQILEKLKNRNAQKA